MPKNIFLSLILTTVDRINQTKHLIQTIEGQKFDLSKIQLIVIDQSNINLEKEVNTELKNIVFIKSNKIGLSKARNLGLSFVKGIIVSFPDDDCYYKQGFFSKLYDIVNSKNGSRSSYWQFPIFAINDKNKSVGRHWKNNSYKINSFNMYQNIASAGMFIRFEDVAQHFSNELGLGSKYPSCEDLIFFWENIIKNQKNAVYVGSKENYIRHPENNYIDISKLNNYNKGHIRAWTIILNQSDFINKACLILYVTLSFLYHFCSYNYYYLKNIQPRGKYHRSIFWGRLKLLIKALSLREN